MRDYTDINLVIEYAKKYYNTSFEATDYRAIEAIRNSSGFQKYKKCKESGTPFIHIPFTHIPFRPLSRRDIEEENDNHIPHID